MKVTQLSFTTFLYAYFLKNCFYFIYILIGFSRKSAVTVVYIDSCEIVFLFLILLFTYISESLMFPSSSWETEACFLLISQVAFPGNQQASKPK